MFKSIIFTLTIKFYKYVLKTIISELNRNFKYMVFGVLFKFSVKIFSSLKPIPYLPYYLFPCPSTEKVDFY